jgi:hypothetical protein
MVLVTAPTMAMEPTAELTVMVSMVTQPTMKPLSIAHRYVMKTTLTMVQITIMAQTILLLKCATQPIHIAAFT